MGATDVRERAILDRNFSAVTTDAPATWHVGLSTTTPNDDGTNFTEPVAMAYARIAVTNNATNFPAASTVGGITSKSNGIAISWATPTGLWGQIVAYGLFTASTGGTCEWWNPLDTPITVNTGNSPVQFAIGTLILTCD